VQSKKDMNRNRPGDELGETNKWFVIMLVNDEGCSYRITFFSGIDSVELHCVPVHELTAFGSPNLL
jgi:hypothetical protein